MIKTIIFDIGNVLLTFNPEEHLKPKMNESTYYEIMKLIFMEGHWHDFDRGLYDHDQLIELFVSKRPDLEKDIHFVVNESYELLQPIFEMHELALQLKENYEISILSNMAKPTAEYILKKYPIFQEFHLPLFSYQHKLIKPQSEIYQIQLDILNKQPHECLFIDDKIENIETAKSLGMHAIQMTTPEDTIPLIKQLLNETKDLAHC